MFVSFGKIILGQLCSFEYKYYPSYPRLSYRFIFLLFYDIIRIPSFNMFFAALMSRWCFVPHSGHIHSRCSSFRFVFWYPQVLHFWLDGKYLPICMNFFPYYWALYFIICMSLYRLIFCNLDDHFLFLNIPLMLRFSIEIMSNFFTMYLLNWWYAFCSLLFFRFIHLCSFF